MDSQKQVIDSFTRKPTTYTIDVGDNSMLPEELKESKEITLVIKPPSTYVLSLCASLLHEIPEAVTESDDVNLETAMQYSEQMIKLILVLSFEKTDYDQWYEEFLFKNLSSVELLQIVQETAIKCNPGFFLNSIQIAKASNPMMLRKN